MWTPRPLVAVHRDKMSFCNRGDDADNKTLTADVERAAECSCNLGVKLNHEFLLLCKLLIATLDLLRDPLPQVVTNDRVDHIDDPLSWKLGDVSFVGHVVLDLVYLHAKLKDALDRESQVARHMQVFRRFSFYDYNNVKETKVHLLFFCPLTMSLRK